MNKNHVFIFKTIKLIEKMNIKQCFMAIETPLFPTLFRKTRFFEVLVFELKLLNSLDSLTP